MNRSETVELSNLSDPVWELPDPVSVRNVAVDGDTSIVLRRHGNPDGPRLVLCHGNGLAIDLYYPFWSILCGDFDIIVYDLRNHGWNEVGPIARHNVPTLVKDHDRVMEAIDEIHGLKPKVGVFHSVSALVSLLSPTRGSEFAARILFDPPLCKPGRSYEEFDTAATRTSAITRRRTDRFQSMEQFVELLGFSPVFRYVVPGALNLMAMTTLKKERDGFGLRCPRDYEAIIIDYASSFAVLVDFEELVCPTKVIGADPTLPYSYLPTLDLSDMLSVDYDFLPDTTHFLPLEKPQDCADIVRDFVTSLGRTPT